MKYTLSIILLLICVVPMWAQQDWPHTDSDPGITVMKGYSYHRISIPDNRGGMWFINQNSYSSSDTIFVVHVNNTNEFRDPMGLSVIKVPAQSGAGGSNRAHVAAISDGSGGIVIFFFRASGALAAQRYDLSGNPLWGISGVTISPQNFFGRSLFAINSNGKYYIGWHNYSFGVISSMQVQRLNPNGVIQWDQLGVSLLQNNTADTFFDLRAAEDAAGGIALCVTRNDSLFWQYIDSTGSRKFPSGLLLNAAAFGYSSNIMYSRIKDAWYVATSVSRYGANSGGDILLHKVLRTSGVFIAEWSADTGKIICKYPGNQIHPLLTADSDDGMLISWIDFRNVVQQGGTRQIFAQRWTKGDAAQWNVNGLQITNNYNSPDVEQKQPIALKNGYIIPYVESNSGIFLQKLNMNGTQQWYPPVGKVHSLINFSSWEVSNLNGTGFLLSYFDQAMNELRMKLMDGNGYLGENAPRVDWAKDIINDQGGRISVLFKDSWQELNSSSNQQGGARSYRLFRGITIRNHQVAEQPTDQSHLLSILTRTDGSVFSTATGNPIYWELINEIPPHGLGTYSKIVTTTSDSGRQGIPWQYIMVGYGNFTSSPLVVWYSSIDSGYSVDNLPPYPPQIPAGIFTGGSVRLHWKKNLEEDLAGYEIYRGTSPSFIPDEQNLIAAVGDTLYQDGSVQSNTNYYYIIKAVDIHGNKSGNSSLVSLNVLSASGNSNVLPTEYALDQNYPNPFNPTTTIAYAVPVNGRVTMRIFDALGRLVETPVDRAHQIGRYSVQFSGANHASGFYLCEIRAEGFVRRIKMNLLK